MKPDPPSRQSQLADQWHACYAELERLAQTTTADWRLVSLPLRARIVRLEGEMLKAQQERNRTR